MSSIPIRYPNCRRSGYCTGESQVGAWVAGAILDARRDWSQYPERLQAGYLYASFWCSFSGLVTKSGAFFFSLTFALALKSQGMIIAVNMGPKLTIVR